MASALTIFTLVPSSPSREIARGAAQPSTHKRRGKIRFRVNKNIGLATRNWFDLPDPKP